MTFNVVATRTRWTAMRRDRLRRLECVLAHLSDERNACKYETRLLLDGTAFHTRLQDGFDEAERDVEMLREEAVADGWIPS